MGNELSNLKKILDEVDSCTCCDVESKNKWFFLPDKEVKIMVVSETPGSYKKPKCDNEGNLKDKDGIKIIDAITSHISNLFRVLFGENNFKPEKNATLYWTHYKKCADGKEKVCKKFLEKELELLKNDLKTVKLVISIGKKASKIVH